MVNFPRTIIDCYRWVQLFFSRFVLEIVLVCYLLTCPDPVDVFPF